KGQVLCLANPRGNAGTPTLPWTLLRIETEPKDGASTCTLFSRSSKTQTTGLRVMLLGTRSGPLRLRLLQAKKGGGFEELPGNVRLSWRRHGFDGEDGTLLAVFGGGGGDVIDTSKGNDKDKGRFDRVAFVSVLSGNDTVKARVPIPLIDDRLVTVPIQ